MTAAHFGVALGLRSLEDARGGTAVVLALLGASLFPDLLDVGYYLIAICNPYGLYSHTIHAVGLQAAVVSGIAFLVTGSRATALLFAAVVLLHPLGDLVTGRKLVVPGGEMYGLRLYERPLLDFLLEASVVFGGWALVRRRRIVPSWATGYPFLVFMLTLLVAFGIRSATRRPGLKPNACPVIQAGATPVRWLDGSLGAMLEVPVSEPPVSG